MAMNIFLQIGLLFAFSINVSAGISVRKIGDLESVLNECSGMEYYKKKFIIAHNDSGDRSRIFLINQEGKVIRTIEVLKAKNNDWEDITSAPDGRLFIADVGNNLNSRKDCQIYILEKNFLDNKESEVIAKKITFVYEDQKEYPPSKTEMYYDAEAVFWMKDSIYIITKCRSKPFTGRSYVYVLPDKPGTYKARKIGEIPFCSRGWMFCSVTAADYYPKTNTLAVLLYGKLVLIKNFPENRFWEGEISTHGFLGIKQRESLTFFGPNSWLMSDEKSRLGGGYLYLISNN
jgi:hypothetical protein